METQLTLTELERQLIDIVRTLPEEQVRQLIEHASRLKDLSTQPASQVRETSEEYTAHLDTGMLPRGVRPEVMKIVQRSLDEYADVWAELAKR